MEAIHTASASQPGCESNVPLLLEMTFVNPSQKMPPATMISSAASMRVASVSYLPWPKGCSWSGRLCEMPTITSTHRSDARSDSEWMPSAIIAPLCPNTPATILAADKPRFDQKPTHVTRLAACSLHDAPHLPPVFFSAFISARKVTNFLIYGNNNKPRCGSRRLPGPLAFGMVPP